MAMSKMWMVLSALVGSGSALVAIAAVQNLENNDQPATRTQPDATSGRAQASKSVTAEISPGRLEALEREVAHLRDERTARDQDTSTLAAEVLDPQAERQRVMARFSELEHRLLADPMDPSWSRPATESLRSDLNAMAAKAGFDVVATECRTEMCRATLRWDNYEAALKTGVHLAERAIPGLNCVKSIWLKEPENPSESYSSSLFLDCSEQRAGNVDTIPTTK